MYISPCGQFVAMSLRISATEPTACGRHLAQPTQNVDKHVATNSTSGNVIRRRGTERRCDSWSSGKFAHSARRAAASGTFGAFHAGSFKPETGRTGDGSGAGFTGAGKFAAADGDSSGGSGSDGGDVLMGE